MRDRDDLHLPYQYINVTSARISVLKDMDKFTNIDLCSTLLVFKAVIERCYSILRDTADRVSVKTSTIRHAYISTVSLQMIQFFKSA